VERISQFVIVSRQCLLATIFVFAAIAAVGAEGQTAPAPEAPQAAAEAPAPAPEMPQAAAEAPAPAPEMPQAAAEAPATPASEAPKPAAETLSPTPKPRKRAGEMSETDAASDERPEKRLRFTFRYQRWGDVLEWFAEQADLSLVLDAPPPGTFNYSDTRDYSVSEAMDLLNSVLLTKGYTLIRRERMLTLIDLSGEFPEGLIPRVSLTELKERGKHELVTVEFPLGRRDPAAATAAVAPLLGPYHKLVPVAPTKQLFVTDRAGVMANVQKVIESIAEPRDPPPAPVPAKPEPRELKVYPIDKADPTALMSILQQLVTTAQLVFDSNLNQLHANATAAQHATIQTTLDQIVSAAATDRERRVEVYRLDAVTLPAATQLVETLKAIAPKATLSLKDDQSALIAWAAPAEHEALRMALDKLGGGPADDPVKSPQLEIYRLTRVDPAKLIGMLERLVPDAKLSYDERSRSLIALAKPADQQAIRATLDQLQADAAPDRDDQPRFETYQVRGTGTAAADDALIPQLQPLVPEAKLSFDARSGRLIVYGTPQEHQLVKSALEKLGLEKPADDPRVMEVYALGAAEPAATLTLLQQLVPEAEFTADAAQQRLVAVAAPADHERIKATLEKLRAIPADTQAARLRFYPFDQQPPAEVLESLAKVAPQAKITVDAENQRLLVVATAAEHTALETAFQQFQQATPAKGKPELAVYPLKSSDAAGALEVLKTLYPKVQIVLDAPAKRLLVWASPEEHASLQASLAKLEAEPAAEQQPQFETYGIRAGGTIAAGDPLLTQLQIAVPEAKITVDAQNRRLIVYGTPQQQQQIRSALEKLGLEKAADDPRVMEVYALGAAEPAATLALLQQLVPAAEFTADAAQQRLVAVAAPADQERIKATLEKLRAAPADDRQPRFESYPIHGFTTAIEAGTLVTSLQPLVPNVRFTIDSKVKNLIAWATEQEQAIVRQALERLGQGPAPQNTPQLEVYRLAKADADTTLALLQKLVPDAQLTLDAKTGNLVALAVPADQLLIRATLEQLQPGSRDDSLGVRFHPLLQPPSEGLLNILREMVPAAQLTPDAENKRLIAVAAAADHEAIQKIVAQFEADTPPDQPRALAVYPVTAAQRKRFEAVLPSLQSEMPGLQLLSDDDPGSLTVWAKPSEQLKIAELVKQLAREVPQAEQLQLATYSCTAADPATISEFVRTLFSDAKFVVDPKTRRIMVWARPQDHERIKPALEQLGMGKPADFEEQFQTYSLSRVGPDVAVPLLQQQLPDAKIVPDAQSNRVLVWATKADQEVIAKAIEQLQADSDDKDKPRLYALKHITADLALRVLTSAIPTAKLSAGADDSQLVAVAQPREHQMLQAILEEIDVEGAAAGKSSVAIYKLEHKASSTAVLYALSVFRSAFPKANFTLGADVGEFVAWATPKDHVGIQTMVDQLNAGPAPENAPQVALYTLQSIPAASALTVLQTAVPRATFSTDPANAQRLTALARPADQDQIKTILTVIDVEGEPGSQPSVVVYQLERQTTATAMTYAISLLTQAFPRARVLLGAEPGQFVAWASAQDHEGIKALVAQLNAGPPPEETPEATVYALQHITATTALSLLTTAVPKAKISADVENPRRLTAYASPADHAAIKTILTAIDVPGDPAGDATVAVYRLEGPTTPIALYYSLAVFRSAFPKVTFSGGAEPGQFAAWATAKEHEGIQALVEQLNAAPAPEDAPQVALYTTKWISAASAAEVLRVAVPKATFTVDTANAQRLTANARTADQETIKTVLATIDVEGDPGTEPSVIVYQLERQISPTATTYAASLLTQAFPHARFLPGTEPGQFVAWASANDHVGIKALVAQLNAGPPPEEAPKATVYSLQHITATAALSLLTTAVPKAKISADVENPRRLTAYASPADHAAIKTILTAIDVEGDPVGDATVAVYRLEGPTTATALYYSLAVFRSAFPKATYSVGAEPGQFAAWATAKEHEGIKALVEQLNAAPAPEDVPKVVLYTLQWITAATATSVLQVAVPKANFTADPDDPQRLAAHARVSDHETIETVLAEIDVEGGGGGRSSAAVYQLERQTSPTAMTYAINLLTQAFPRARFLTGTEIGQFVAWATAKDQEEITALVDRLNAGPPPEEAPQATVYSLQHITAATALSLLATAVPKAKLAPDAEDPRRLTAYASPADQAAIKEILGKIDVESDAPVGATVAVYLLESQPTAASLYYTLAVFRTAFPKATFSTGADAGQFVAWASAKDHEGIQTLVDQLNAGPPQEQKLQVELYALASIPASSAAEVLRAAVPKAIFTVDPANAQRLTANARPADHETIKTVLAKIDVEGDPGTEPSVAVYQLERQTTATAMTYALTLLTQAFPRARFLIGTDTGQFVAWASAKDHEGIQALVDRLNAGPPPDEAPEATVYPLQHVTATTALTLLATAVPKAQFAPDAADPRRLTAYASPADQAIIKQILDKIDIEGDPTGGATVAVYQLDGQATAPSVYYTLTVFRTAFPRATFSVGAEAGQFVAWATPKEHEGIQSLVEQLNAELPPEQKAQVALYTLQFMTATVAADVLRTAVPKATFTTDPDDPQRLTANARPADHETIKQVLAEIDVEGEGGGRSTVEVYKLLGPQAETAMTYAFRLLTSAFPRARFSLGTEPAQFVAWASPRDHVEIRALVDRLNAAPPPEEAPTAAVYSLKNITATTALSVLTSALPRVKLTADAADPQRLTAYATPIEQATVKEILTQIDVAGDPDASYSVQIYTLEGMSTRALYYTGIFLARVLPNARFTPGAEEAQLVVWATAKDHAQIAGLIEQLQKDPPPELARKIAVYSLQHITGDAALTLLRSVVPKAELTTNPADAQRINAWASPADHTRIQAILKEVDVKPDPESAATAAVYQLEGMSQTAALYALRFLREAVPQANFALGGEGGQLVAWARAADHEVIAQLVKQLVEESPDAARTAQVYNLQHATAATALSALAPVVPRASLSIGADPSQLAVFARPQDHAKIAEILKQLDQPAPPETEPTAVVYTIQSGSAAEAMRIVRVAVPQANLSTGAEPHQMIAWARPADHRIIQQIVERMGEKGPAELARKVAVYSIESGDAATAMTLLQTAVPGAQFSVGADPRRLIAWATPADHEAIQKAVDEIGAGAAQMTSQVYRLRYGDPQTALTVLQALVPLAKMAIDTREGTLVASALPEDHLKIKATIEQMDTEDADGQRPALKIHRVTIGSVSNVYRSLALLFRTDPTVQLSLDVDNDAVIAIASGAKQERIVELVKSLEDAARQDALSTIQLYSLRNVDSRSVLRILGQMLDKQDGKADLSIDQLSNQLVAVAPPKVHEQIAKTIDQLRGDESELEIYDLQYVDPASAEMAIYRQFTDDGARAPEVSIDPITQQLFIRATAEQQQKIRELLIKMGETRLALLRGRSSQNMRTIPFQGDPKAAVEEIRRIWATLRDNEIRVVEPDQPLPAPAARGNEKPADPPKAAEARPPEENKPPAADEPSADEKPATNEKPAGKPRAKSREKSVSQAGNPASAAFQFVAFQAGEDDSAPPPEPPPPAPIYVVPSDGSITIVCDDPEALEQFEKLLRAMSGTSGEIGRNISIYLLKHSNAVEMAEKLRELYDTRRRSWRLGGSEVVIVPDERLNRILVQGSRIDRETIDGLIRALDTEEGTASRPQIVPVRYAEATDVANVVREVFRSQLTRTTAGTTAAAATRTSSASRIMPQVAVDEATNSLIVMAPSPLLDEILKLVNNLDESAEQNPARRLRIISLQKTSAARVDEALQRILKSRSPRPAR